MNPLVIILCLSLLGNALLAKVWLGERDDRIEAGSQRDQARSAASVCSDATKALQEQAQQAKVENAAAVARAAASATARAKAAQVQLATPATRPGDDCGSARDRIDAWINNRSKP